MIEVVWRKPVVENEKHKAFTDIAAWGGRHWLTYREGDSHAGGEGRVMAISSADEGESWSEPVCIVAEPLDSRDPKLVAFRGRLWCVAAVWPGDAGVEYSPRPYVTWTRDGATWSAPEPVFGPPTILWRPVSDGARLYAGLYHPTGPHNSPEHAPYWESCLAISEDGTNWREWATITSSNAANETQVQLLLPDRTMLAVVRREAAPDADSTLVFRASPPYADWEQAQDLGVRLHAPCMAWIGGQLLLAGRVFEPATPDRGTGEWSESLDVWQWLDGSFAPAGQVWEPQASIDAHYVGIAPVGNVGNEALLSTYIGQPDGQCDIWVARLRVG